MLAQRRETAHLPAAVTSITRHGLLYLVGVVATLACIFSGAPGVGRAATVVLVDHDTTILADDAFLRSGPALSTPSATRARILASARSGPTVPGILARLQRTGQITPAASRTYRADFAAALRMAKRLSSTRRTVLEAVIENLHAMAVDGSLTASRLPAVFLTLDRNRQYWQSGRLLSYGQRVEFAGSQLVWEYYPGQGIQLQELGSFGKADGLCLAGKADAARCRSILAELIPLAVRRAGGLTWEYYFKFDGGTPPWTSAMSQGTALQALADAYKELKDPSYLSIAHAALAVFTAAPPTGVGVSTPTGARYVQYSFASGRGVEVINALLQTLIGLDDYAQASGDPVAARLFARGTAEAQAELPSFNTGAWSLYQPAQEDDLSYHQLVTGFLQQLCAMTQTPIYCQTAAAFQRDLKTPPALSLMTRKLTPQTKGEVYFTVSKIARVGITIIRSGTTVFLTSASFPHGTHAFAVPALRPGGSYTVRLDATDLAGNYNQISTPIRVAR
jgi:D-glucuronyl C5-epimerase C-terminus